MMEYMEKTLKACGRNKCVYEEDGTFRDFAFVNIIDLAFKFHSMPMRVLI